MRPSTRVLIWGSRDAWGGVRDATVEPTGLHTNGRRWMICRGGGRCRVRGQVGAQAAVGVATIRARRTRL